MYLIQIGVRYFSATGGFCGRLTASRAAATLFTLADANERASRLGHTCRVVPV